MQQVSPKLLDLKCEYCDKVFSAEKRLIAHCCQKKMRMLDRDNKNSQIGFLAYQRFYQLTSSKKNIKFEEFIYSSMYNDFLKFGMWLNDSYILNPMAYIDYVIKNNIKISKWAHEKTYEAYLRTFILNEHPGNALERNIAWMSKYCTEQNINLEDFFSSIGPNKLVDLLRSGKISPWMLLLSSKQETQDLWNNFDAGQLKLLNNLLDTKVWNIKMRKFSTEINEYQSIMQEASL